MSLVRDHPPSDWLQETSAIGALSQCCEGDPEHAENDPAATRHGKDARIMVQSGRNSHGHTIRSIVDGRAG